MILTYDSKEYKRSRGAYAIECAFEYFVALLMADAFLAKLLTNLGFTDAQVGILSSFISLAFLFELCAVPVVSKITNTKRFAIIFHTSSQAFFMFLYLIPLLFGVKSGTFVKALVPACLLLAYFGNYFVTTTIYRWGNSYVDPQKRGVFQANKEMISLISGVVVSLIVGVIIDKFEEKDNLFGGFLFSAIAIAVFAVCDLICLLTIKNGLGGTENDGKEENAKHSIGDIMKNTFGNRSYRMILYFSVLYSVALYFTNGFLGTYKTGDLAFSLTVIQIINILGQMARFAVSRPFGKLADKTSFSIAETAGLLVMLAGYVCLIFASPATNFTRYLIIPNVILYNASLAGTHQNQLMMTYNYVPGEYYVEATAIKKSIAGLCGFFASLAAGKILAVIQDNGNVFLGMNVYGQQVLGVCSLLVTLAALALNHFVIRKLPIIGH